MSDEQTTPWKGTIEWVLSLPCVVDEPGARLVYEVMQRLKPQLEQRIAAAVAAECERCAKMVADNADYRAKEAADPDVTARVRRDQQFAAAVLWEAAAAIRTRAGEGEIDNPPVI